ncbi:hypothetical protein CAEBREN_04880 [Caenorhabditis brenneri]|uniref:Uncharacterized protein n=1 Tax=Caenorhabditis brenneri TaxID=135651 RepID=G0PN12_CAEBE|nr:hypothetical protein CAEBREN_04880 [Caenorhabditis brenneri]
MDSIEKKRLERSMTGATPTEQKRSKTENVKRIRRTSSETSEEYDNDPRNYNGLFDQSEQFDSFRSPPKRSYRDNEEELMNLDDGESIIPKKRLLSSELDLWKPANLISNTCYDKSTGLLLSKEQCDENLKKTMKTKRGIDYYGILQSSSSNSSKTLAFLAYQINKIISKTDIRSKEERNTSSNLFDLEAAREISKNVFLPGGKKVIISMLIDHALCASWVGTNVLCKSVVSVLEEMKCRDPWFLVYSAPATHRSTSYVRLEPDFFSKFAGTNNHVCMTYNLHTTASETLSAGFGWPMDSKNLSNLIDKITGITRNFIDNLFRVLEPPLHDDIRQNRYSQRKHLLDDDNLKNKDSDNYVENMEMETNMLTNRSTHVDRQNDQNEAYDSCFEHNAIEASAPAKEPPPSIDDFSAEERVEFRLINNRCVQNEYSSDDDDIEDYSASFNTPKLKTNLLSSSSKNVDSRQDNKYESISGSS